MTLLATHLLAVAIGAVCTWAYARIKIAEIKRDDLSFRMAPTVTHSIEDAIRRAGV